MEFVIRRAEISDLKGIMQVMDEARENPVHPDWFVADDEEFVREHLEEKGFIVAAQAPDGEIAGFFLVKVPDREENLGVYLGFTEEELTGVAVMDSTAVGSAYRGHGLQGRMLDVAEQMIDREMFPYLMCTVHPENIYSLHNMEKHGYEVKKTTECYGGLKRHILLKDN